MIKKSIMISFALLFLFGCEKESSTDFYRKFSGATVKQKVVDTKHKFCPCAVILEKGKNEIQVDMDKDDYTAIKEGSVVSGTYNRVYRVTDLTIQGFYDNK